MTANIAADPLGPPHDGHGPPLVEVIIEIPRFSFLKRGSTGHLDFVSPIPCPFNYGSVPGYVADDRDWLDALVLGPRLPAGTRLEVPAFGAVGFTDRDIYDDKLVCGACEPTEVQRQQVLRFFHRYARAKRVLNLWRGRPGRTACDGWGDARDAIDRTRPSAESSQLDSMPF